jgi:crotonobetainyl-CoA:carnitine CoA-transferase CaiB-like acyl-CoA transferase
MEPLAGVRVLDFSWVVAGPAATRILASLGAEVIKVERKVPGFIEPRRVGLHGDLNANKLSVAINMAHPRGVELARPLAAKSDIIIDNFSARVMRQWGMDYASLLEIKPDIICISMSGFGRGGPRTNYVSYGPTLQALSGFTLLMAEESGEPAGFGYSYADMAVGYTGALAALVALWDRRRTGRGQFIDLSQFEATVSVIGPALLDISINGRAQQPCDYRPQEGPAGPHGVYRCACEGDDDDRWVAISVRSQAQWERFTEAIGSPAWSRDPRFSTLYMRMRNRAELDANISGFTRGRRAEDVMSLLQAAGIPAGLVSNGKDLCARDPQLKARGFWRELSLSEGGATRVTGVPFKLAGESGVARACAPEIGENNDYVLGTLLGLGRAEREELIAEGAIWP